MAQYRSQIFASRLRELCDAEPSYAYVAEQLGITRQQLSRYLAGNTMPRDGMMASISNYFDISIEKLFSDESLARKTTSHPSASSNNPIDQFFSQVAIDPISDADLEPGFYRQYKKIFIQPGKILMSLVHVTKDGDNYYYKRRTSAKYAKIFPGTSTKNYFSGIFVKHLNCLLMFDLGSQLNDLTFHTLRTRYNYDTNIKFGYHINVLNANDEPPVDAATFILERIPSNDNILSAARSQGLYEQADLPEHITNLFG